MSLADTTPKNIILIGFMGSGKSTVGRALQKLLGYKLVDLDQSIEESMGKRIAEIFAEEGEVAFRDFETLQLLKTANEMERRHIISTGGGAVIRERNRKILKKLGFVVWLRAPEEVIFERTSKNADRPLLNRGDARQKITELMNQREPWYEETAHMQVDTTGLDSAELATGILESARYFFSS